VTQLGARGDERFVQDHWRWHWPSGDPAVSDSGRSCRAGPSPDTAFRRPAADTWRMISNRTRRDQMRSRSGGCCSKAPLMEQAMGHRVRFALSRGRRMLSPPGKPLISWGFLRLGVGACSGGGKSSTPAPLPSLGPHRAPVNAELLRESVHADAVLAGCSHSVHFLAREACSRSFLWFRRRPDQSVIHLVHDVGITANPLIPRGNELLNPWSSVSAALNCVHPETHRQSQPSQLLRQTPPSRPAGPGPDRDLCDFS
jgi:hypothetical protein